MGQQTGLTESRSQGYAVRVGHTAISLVLLVSTIALLTCLAPTSALAAVEETHVFDPTLSLTGDCSTATVDTVADPGTCPIPPGVPGVDHPNAAFKVPKGVAVDAYGNRYVASYGPEEAKPNEGRIDIFDPTGHFITEITDTNGPKALAVDAAGNLYVHEKTFSAEFGKVVRYPPSEYEPKTGQIKYSLPSVVVVSDGGAANGQIAVDRSTGHLFFQRRTAVSEFGSAAEGNPLLDKTIGEGQLTKEGGTGFSAMIAIDAAHQRIYDDAAVEGKGNVIKVFDLKAPHELLATIDGSTTPAGEFQSTPFGIAVEESTGHIFVGDTTVAKKVYELEANGSYVSTIKPSAGSFALIGYPQMVVDNSPKSPNRGYLYVPSGEGNPGRSLAFKPLGAAPQPPVIESFSFDGVTETEATLRAEINPEGQETSYHFEYVTQENFEAEEFANPTVAGEGTVPPVATPQEVSTHLEGLQPGTAYRLRIVAESKGGSDQAQRSLSTYSPPEALGNCSNESLRSGPSAHLPDCRAYELVTPANTNGRSPVGGSNLGEPFGTRLSSPDGGKLSFVIEGGALPGYDGTGYIAGDPYLATRTASGWSTTAVGASGEEVAGASYGGISSDQGYFPWGTAVPVGGAAIEGKPTNYIHYPDGHSELVGQGSLGTTRSAHTQFISQGGTHIIFSTVKNGADDAPPVPLEPNAPPEGTPALYDRTADEVTHVVSLKPGEVTPAEHEDALFEGVSEDGNAVAFKLRDPNTQSTFSQSPLFLRVDDAETLEAASAGSTFAGLSADGSRLFYLQGGSLYAFDVATHEIIGFAESGDVTVVNVAADGAAAYFLSPTVYPEMENPLGEVPQPGGENLYFSQESAVSFVGVVTAEDVKRQVDQGTKGLGLWIGTLHTYVSHNEADQDPSRTTPSGGVLVFESRAPLTGQSTAGPAEVYRYDASVPALECLSCSPTQAPASGGSSLASIKFIASEPTPLEHFILVNNLRDDGQRIFFQTPEPLVLADTDESQDVYEWEEEGVGSCEKEGGCTYLISSGRSAEPNYLFAVSDSGDDVFISTTDLLTQEDPDETRSVYDARVNGGFPTTSVPGECLGESCQPAASPPEEVTPASSTFHGAGNVNEEPTSTRCPKGKKARQVGGKTRCVAKHHKKRHHKAKKRANTSRRAGR
jgi:hypothetical protein